MSRHLTRRLNLPAFAILAVLVLFFEITVSLGWIPAFLFPPPSKILKTLLELKVEFFKAFLET
ncbi:MAG: hypothetical protein ACXWRE_06240, partial [Pseudobdellovibrionaceae bacterium]